MTAPERPDDLSRLSVKVLRATLMAIPMSRGERAHADELCRRASSGAASGEPMAWRRHLRDDHGINLYDYVGRAEAAQVGMRVLQPQWQHDATVIAVTPLYAAPPSAVAGTTDTERLDWLDGQKELRSATWDEDNNWIDPRVVWRVSSSVAYGQYGVPQELKRISLRAAIDAARASSISGPAPEGE